VRADDGGPGARNLRKRNDTHEEYTGAADDLELVSWLCERIWVLQGNFTHEDGYAAARISVAEMLLSGTTCFLESMVGAVLFFVEVELWRTNA
jgi:cytosine/adenosine deaminase-related metal-dependent hydrolase